MGLTSEIRQAQMAFVDEWSDNFESEYQKFLYMVTTNIQQGKVLKMLNTMTEEKEEHGEKAMVQDVNIKRCGDIHGAEDRDQSKYPLCKCAVYNRRTTHTIFCGTEPILDADGQQQRKFNATEVLQHPACKYSQPYCSGAAAQHQLTDLAKLLNPKPDNCDTLYDELVDSSIDILVNNVGSLMYYLVYDSPDAPIVKRSGFAMQLYSKIKGDDLVSEDLLAARFSSLGQKKMLAEKVLKMKLDVEDINRA